MFGNVLNSMEFDIVFVSIQQYSWQLLVLLHLSSSIHCHADVAGQRG